MILLFNDDHRRGIASCEHAIFRTENRILVCPGLRVRRNRQGNLLSINSRCLVSPEESLIGEIQEDSRPYGRPNDFVSALCLDYSILGILVIVDCPFAVELPDTETMFRSFLLRGSCRDHRRLADDASKDHKCRNQYDQYTLLHFDLLVNT